MFSSQAASAANPGDRAIFALVIVIVLLAVYMFASQHPASRVFLRQNREPLSAGNDRGRGFSSWELGERALLGPWESGAFAAAATGTNARVARSDADLRVDTALMSPLMRHAGALAAEGVSVAHEPYGGAALPRATKVLNYYDDEDGGVNAFGKVWRREWRPDTAPRPRVGESLGPAVTGLPEAWSGRMPSNPATESSALTGTAYLEGDRPDMGLGQTWHDGAEDYYDPAAGNARPYLSGKGNERFRRLTEPDESPYVGATSWL